MATVSSLNIRIGANIKELQTAMQRAGKSVEQLGDRMTSVGKTLSMRLTAPLAALGGLAIKQAADFETLQQSMNALNGSVEEGTRNFERLKKFSATTPFQLQDLAKAQNMLQGFGLAADEAFQSMKMIGDVAAITGGDIHGIGIAFGQAAAEGRLMTQDIRQLINQGVPAIQLLAETMGVAESEILSLASEGRGLSRRYN
jgi:tape measure domain-containing protein